MYDQHLHTCFSYDASPDSTPGNVVKKAISLGIKGVAITDHLDPLWPDEEFPSIIDLPAYGKALFAAEEAASDIAPDFHFAKGIELGLMPIPESISICTEAVIGFPYDFVIASVHSSPTSPVDFDSFLLGRSVKEINEEYYSLLFESIKLFKDYDVLGHLNAIDRYTDTYAPEDVYMPFVDEILRVAISDGKGIEINTSSYRYEISDRGTPSQAILNRFKELGGEIVTIGSDAHKISDIGTYLSEGAEMLMATGIEHITVFKNRTPTFVKL